jgi:exonuclease VII small subunit
MNSNSEQDLTKWIENLFRPLQANYDKDLLVVQLEPITNYDIENVCPTSKSYIYESPAKGKTILKQVDLMGTRTEIENALTNIKSWLELKSPFILEWYSYKYSSIVNKGNNQFELTFYTLFESGESAAFKYARDREFLRNNRLKLVSSVLHAYKYMITKNTFHGRIRPENIIITGSSTIKLADNFCKSAPPQTNKFLRIFKMVEPLDSKFQEKTDIFIFGLVILYLFDPEDIGKSKNFETLQYSQTQKECEQSLRDMLAHFNNKVDDKPFNQLLHAMLEVDSDKRYAIDKLCALADEWKAVDTTSVHNPSSDNASISGDSKSESDKPESGKPNKDIEDAKRRIDESLRELEEAENLIPQIEKELEECKKRVDAIEPELKEAAKYMGDTDKELQEARERVKGIDEDMINFQKQVEEGAKIIEESKKDYDKWEAIFKEHKKKLTEEREKKKATA